jgi:hypothetical protein
MSRLGWRAVGALVAVAALGAAAAVGLILRSSGGDDARSARAGNFHRTVEIEGRAGGEEDREGATSPSAEQVANRAYPRNYVDDRRALAVRRAFDRVPRRTPRSAFRTARAAEAAADVAPARWANLGPVTPNVAGEASQFFDPDTLQGPPTQESGRVTALAVDPACHPGDCRLWVASAGGGIWRTPDALAPKPVWIAPPDDLPTNAFGSVLFDAGTQTLYAGSGEPNGSGDSEAGVGLFKSTDYGATWTLVGGSRDAAINRSIGAIAVDPGDPNTIYIGTDLARHGSSSVNGGRRTPPNAPPLGLYKSTDGGATFHLMADLSHKTPPDPTPPGEGTGIDWFQGGVNKIELDPNHPSDVYAAVFGYGLWRSGHGGDDPWVQVFHTVNQNDFSDPANPVGDSTGDRTEFDLVNVGSGTTRAYLGDASDDFVLDEDPATPLPQVWRTDDIQTIAGAANGDYDNAGWTELSNDQNGTNGYLAYGYCQNGQCGYDSFVASPPGKPNDLWLGGSMNYDELPAYAGQPPRSNGRAVIRSTNAGAAAADVTWNDMTAVLGSDAAPWDVTGGLHPDEHAVAFAEGGNIAFVGSDGGVARVDVTSPVDRSGACDQRSLGDPADLLDCRRLLQAIPSAITPVNDGLATLQFQSLSFNPSNPTGDVLGGTQDNGTWSYTGSPAWFESVGGDGGQSGFNVSDPTIRYHNYYDATPEVNYHADNPRTWLDTYDVLLGSGEGQSFYTPFEADPVTGGRVYTGLEHVWRSDDNGGSEAALGSRCNALQLDPNRLPCGDWIRIGQRLTAASFGDRAGEYVVATERAPSDTGTLWAATRTGRVFVSSNADAAPIDVQFTRIDTPQTPGRFVTGIAIDPQDPNHAWVSYTGYDAYTPSTPGHVFEVVYNPQSGAAQWTDRSYNLGDQPVTGIAFYGKTRDVYAATDFGVLRLARGSSSWSDAAPGLPRVAVYGLTLSDNGAVLYAATHGRGAYALQLPANPAGSIAGPSDLRVGRPATFTAAGQAWDGQSVQSFSWELPGVPGSATGPTATFTPLASGTATVKVTLTDTDLLSTTLSRTVTVAPAGGKRVDRTRPHVRLRHVARVRLGKRVTFRGRITDAGGIRSVTVFWGDRTRTKVRLSARGRFAVHHRYKKAGRYRIRLVAIDRAGNRTTRHVSARVLTRRR